MAGTALASELTVTRASRVHFALATEADDDEIRRLLRENPMPGQITISLEREPSYFFEERDLPAERQTIVARENDRVICVGSCSFRQRFVNGQPQRVGYLGGLRLDAKLAGRFDILRRGYRFFREQQPHDDREYCFTSIAADNERAIQLLERGLPGMPTYETFSDFVTLLIAVPRNGVKMHDTSLQQITTDDFDELAAWLSTHGCRYQFAPYWTTDELLALHSLELRAADFRVVRDRNRIIACAALWDQRAFKQTVIQGYAAPLSLARKGINLAALLAGHPQFPAIGAVLKHAMVSHLAIGPNQPDALSTLIQGLFPLAREKGIEFLTLGYAVGDPRLETVRANFGCREYRSRLYSVRWPGMGAAPASQPAPQALDGRLAFPEVALL